MAANPPVQQEKQVVLDPQAVEIGFGEGWLQTTAVLSPPVTRLKELRGTLRGHWQTTFRQEHFSAADASIAKNEFQRLIVRYEICRNSASYLVRLASLARIVGDADNARRFALEAESISPTDDVRFQRAKFELTSSTNREKARYTLEQLAVNGYRSAGLRLAELYIAESDIRRARDMVNIVLHQEPLDWRTNLLAGTIALMDGRMPEAIRLFRVASLDRPNSTVLFTNLAFAHYVIGNVRQAIKAIRISLGLNPLDQKALSFFLDIGPMDKKSTAVVIRLLDQFIRFAPDVQQIPGRAANYFLEIKEYKRGIAALERLASSTSDPEIANNFAVLLSRGGRRKEAAREFSRAMRLATADQRTYPLDIQRLIISNLAHALIEVEAIDVARSLTRNALMGHSEQEIVSDHQLARIKYADLLAALYSGGYDAVVAYATRHLANDNIDRLFKINLLTQLVCYYTITKEDVARALKFAVTADELLQSMDEPDAALIRTVKNNLAFCLVEDNQLDAARRVLQHISFDEAAESATYALATRGLYHIRKGQIDLGVRDYRRAISLSQKYEGKTLLRKKLEYELARVKETQAPREAVSHAKRALKLGEAKGFWPSNALDARLNELMRRIEWRSKPH